MQQPISTQNIFYSPFKGIEEYDQSWCLSTGVLIPPPPERVVEEGFRFVSFARLVERRLTVEITGCDVFVDMAEKKREEKKFQ